MNLDLTPDQLLLVETTKRFLDNEATATDVRALRHDPLGFDPAFWRQGCELGWTSLLVDESDGGGSVSEAGLEDLVQVAFEFGRHAAPGPLLTTNVVAHALGRSGSEAHKREVLEPLLTGEVVATWAMSEPQGQSAFDAVRAEAVRDGTSWVLTGTKVAVEALPPAAHLLVVARAGGGLTQYLVPADADGISCTPMRSVDLTRRFAEVRLDRVRVDGSAVVGEVGGAAGDVRRSLAVAHVLQCAETVGAMDLAMEMTMEWLFQRYSFGRPLGSYQAIKHRAADMKTWLEASHALLAVATHAVQADDDNAEELCSAAKAYIGQVGPELVQECIQFHGGIGVTFDHDIHLYLRRATLNSALLGTVTDHRLRLADILETRLPKEVPA